MHFKFDRAVDKALEVVMTKGHKTAGGDRLGKTIIFAKNNDHADFIARRFDVNYPHYKGHFARVVTYKTEYAQMVLIQSVASDDWWDDVTVPMLETVRRRLRALVKLIPKGQKKIVYTDFEDELGESAIIDLPQVTAGLNMGTH
ncbi:type I site-specific restriction endonuclease [Paraburkholderia sp. WC7.3g]|uniref:hypothetical protein n=1 Tax=Paraburkholderia sp. WC7.3g TaxID=2991070 RepID=UPI003D1B5245